MTAVAMNRKVSASVTRRVSMVGSLVGREHELGVFEQALDRLARGSSQVIEVTGDPGIGKTRLLAELAHLARDHGVPVLDGRAQHGGERIPFYALLAFAYRWRQVPARLRTAVATAGGGYPPVHLRLGPLSAAEAEALLAGRGSQSWRRGLYRASGGNPFYLDVLARSGRGPRTCDPDGMPADGTSAGEELAPTVTLALLAEVDALSPAGQLAARSAAVIGDPFCVMSVGEVSGLDQNRAAASIAELAAADLIRPIDPTRLFSFRHALVRSAAYESADPAWQVGAHGRAAAALRNWGAPLTAQAHHIERAAEFGDLGAVSLLAEAASIVQTQAPGTAAQWLRAALRLLPETEGPGQQRTALLFRLAFALGAAGHSRASRDTLLIGRVLALRTTGQLTEAFTAAEGAPGLPCSPGHRA